MLIPRCGKRRFPSKLQYDPSGPTSRQRESRALTTNHPSPSTTRPFFVSRIGASGMLAVSHAPGASSRLTPMEANAAERARMSSSDLRGVLADALGDPRRVSDGDSERDLHASDI